MAVLKQMRDDSPSVPDQVLERLLHVIELLFNWWWWTCDEQIWEQVLMLAGSVIGGLSAKGKARERDEETKDRAATLLLCLLKGPTQGGKQPGDVPSSNAGVTRSVKERLTIFQQRAQAPRLVPVLGMTYDALLKTASSANSMLQLHSLQVARIIAVDFFPDPIVPSVLPGTISTATRVALGQMHAERNNKGWVKGHVAAGALDLISEAIIRAIGDEACSEAGLVKELSDLGDLVELVSEDAVHASSDAKQNADKPYETIRTASWLKATSSQLIIALNSLSPLVRHPTATALVALSSLSQSLLLRARLTLTDARQLLLSYLLTLSISQFPSVSSHASQSLSSLLTSSSKGSHTLLQTLLQQATSNLSLLAHLITSRSDTRLIHAAGKIEAACRLSSENPSIGAGVAQLLGPSGHIERWGWRLLAVLQFNAPAPVVFGSGISGLLEGSMVSDEVVFPTVMLHDIATKEAQDAIERMLNALGSASGINGLFTVEWFVKVGLSGRASGNSEAALWCACKMLEGITGVSLNGAIHLKQNDDRKWARDRRMEKFARWLAKAISELWDKIDDDIGNTTNGEAGDNSNMGEDDQDLPAIEFSTDNNKIQTRFDLRTMTTSSFISSQTSGRPRPQPILQKAFSLQLLALSAHILVSQFSTTLIYTLYPIMHSLIQSSSHLSATSFASLQHITAATGFATPANLLFANFDYALDSVSRRLTKRNLDVDAAKVLSVLVRLVGKDVVQRASDVVEECFERLDEYHGYAVIVEGIVDALLEVVMVVGDGEELEEEELEDSPLSANKPMTDEGRFLGFLHWIERRKDSQSDEQRDNVDPAPREPLNSGKSKELAPEEEQDEARDLNKPSALDEAPLTPAQTLTSMLLGRSLTLMTHPSRLIRTRILTLLTAAAPHLSARPSAILPQIHRAWPFILNRLKERDGAVVAAAAGLVEALVRTQGDFMSRRVWEDVWPTFRSLLAELDKADKSSALARRGVAASIAGIGTESRHTHSHRLYLAMLRTMSSAIQGGVNVVDKVLWDVLLAFRRFLSRQAHVELQGVARELYVAVAKGGIGNGNGNADAVWLVLWSTAGRPGGLKYLAETRWDIASNVDEVLAVIDSVDLVLGVQQQSECTTNVST